jgi:hypothetical protein
MDRRSFLHSLAAPAVAAEMQSAGGAQTAAPRTRLYRIDYCYYRQGDQGTRLNQFLSLQTPLFLKHTRVFGVFSAVMAPHTQTTMVLSGYSGMEEMSAASSRIEADSGYQKAHAELESGAEPPFDSAQTVLLAATSFSPEIAMPAEKPKAPRYFELRVYHSPTQRQQGLLHERFAGHEIEIFHRVGVRPILYADTIVGPDLPNMTYVIPFASLAEREAAWDKFAADPEWVKVRAESVAKGGQIVSYNQISLWRATAYSPIQ